MPIILSAALALTQLAQASPQHDPEIEALLRHRDERRRAEAEESAPAPEPTPAPAEAEDDGAALSEVIPPAIAAHLAQCLERANADPALGISDAQSWVGTGGGAYAAQCHGYALGKMERWAEAADTFERGARLPDADTVTRARLWSQAGNAALLAGDAPRAARDLDQALTGALPATLTTGEIHLDRARARVATNDLKGARADLDQAIVLAKGDPLAWLLSATLARRMNDLPLARQHIEEAARRAPNDAPVALEQGVIYALSGDRDEDARAAFRHAQELAGTDGKIAQQAADYLAQLGPEPGKAAKPIEEVGR
jgi:tetratricopeptide (TPR) repeat protein